MYLDRNTSLHHWRISGSLGKDCNGNQRLVFSSFVGMPCSFPHGLIWAVVHKVSLLTHEVSCFSSGTNDPWQGYPWMYIWSLLKSGWLLDLLPLRECSIITECQFWVVPSMEGSPLCLGRYQFLCATLNYTKIAKLCKESHGEVAWSKRRPSRQQPQWAFGWYLALTFTRESILEGSSWTPNELPQICVLGSRDEPSLKFFANLTESE